MSPIDLTNYLRTLKDNQIFTVRVHTFKCTNYDIFIRKYLFDTLESIAFEYTRVSQDIIKRTEILQLYTDEIFYSAVLDKDLSEGKIVKI